MKTYRDDTYFNDKSFYCFDTTLENDLIDKAHFDKGTWWIGNYKAETVICFKIDSLSDFIKEKERLIVYTQQQTLKYLDKSFVLQKEVDKLTESNFCLKEEIKELNAESRGESYSQKEYKK